MRRTIATVALAFVGLSLTGCFPSPNPDADNPSSVPTSSDSSSDHLRMLSAVFPYALSPRPLTQNDVMGAAGWRAQDFGWRDLNFTGGNGTPGIEVYDANHCGGFRGTLTVSDEGRALSWTPYDGPSFTCLGTEPAGEAPPMERVSHAAVDQDGTLWLAFDSARTVLSYSRGTLRPDPPALSDAFPRAELPRAPAVARDLAGTWNVVGGGYSSVTFAFSEGADGNLPNGSAPPLDSALRVEVSTVEDCPNSVSVTFGTVLPDGRFDPGFFATPTVLCSPPLGAPTSFPVSDITRAALDTSGTLWLATDDTTYQLQRTAL